MIKEEKKDEMKNRISMALKDPILQQGFEIICKNLAELERLNSNQAESLRITMLEEEKKDKRIAELEKENARLTTNEKSLLAERKIIVKENAELKKKLKEKLKNIADKDLSFVAKFDALEKENAEQKDQLTKAKEIIRKLVLEVKGYEEINGYDTCEPVKEAEQFLKEIEK